MNFKGNLHPFYTFSFHEPSILTELIVSNIDNTTTMEISWDNIGVTLTNNGIICTLNI